MIPRSRKPQDKMPPIDAFLSLASKFCALIQAPPRMIDIFNTCSKKELALSVLARLNHGLLENHSRFPCQFLRDFENEFVMYRSDYLSSSLRQSLGK